MKNAEGGVQISDEVARTLVEIAEGSNKVGDLVAEIAAAAKEQAQGIEQINTAVSQMDQVTQQNASNSEESASAAEELNSQAEELQQLVSEFHLTRQEGAGNGRRAMAATPEHRHPVAAAPRNRLSATLKKNGGNGHQAKAGASCGDKRKPQDIIPLDDADFADF